MGMSHDFEVAIEEGATEVRGGHRHFWQPGRKIDAGIADTRGSCDFPVRVQPRASKDEIAGLMGGALKVRLRAAALEGRANEALCEYLASF